MIVMLATLEFSDYAGIALLLLIFSGAAFANNRTPVSHPRLESQVQDLQRKVDALLKFHRISPPPPPPSGLSPEVEAMARFPEQKIAAIKRYRDENPGVGLAEAKTKIEEFAAKFPRVK